MHPLIPFHFLRAQWERGHLHGERLRHYQDARARAMVRYANAHSPFYKTHHAAHDMDRWRDLPTVDKRQMMDHFDTFNTRGVTRDEAMDAALTAERSRDFAPTVRGNLTVGLSSGTSGHRGLFLVSPTETAAWAGTVLSRVLHRLPKPGYRVAFFLRSNSNLYERVGGSGRVVFRWFDLMMPAHEAIATLNVYQPDLLVGPPSLLLSLADAAQRGLLRIRPERLVSVAETLEAQDRAMLEAAFGVPVGQVYQCTEGFLAATCSHGRLHVNEDLVVLQYEELGEGKVSPIVTDLWRHTQPIIRYRMGDVLTLDSRSCPCGCGFQVIEAIEGRSDDICTFPALSTGEPRRFYPDTIRRMILLASENITDYVAVQERCGHLRIHLAVKEDTEFKPIADAVRKSAMAVLAQYQATADILQIEQGLPLTVPGAKRRRVINTAESPRSIVKK